MTKEQQQIINKFILALTKAEAFVPEVMLPEDMCISKESKGSLAMISVAKIMSEWKKCRVELDKTQDFSGESDEK